MYWSIMSFSGHRSEETIKIKFLIFTKYESNISNHAINSTPLKPINKFLSVSTYHYKSNLQQISPLSISF